jgi:acyl carrier protein
MESNRVEALRARVEAIWKEILEMPDGQTQATFFELKGDSISAIRLVSRIEEELDVLLDVGDLFEDDQFDRAAELVPAQAGVAVVDVVQVEAQRGLDPVVVMPEIERGPLLVGELLAGQLGQALEIPLAWRARGKHEQH